MARRILALASLAILALAAMGAPALVQAGGGCHGDANGASPYMEADGTTVIRMDVCTFAPTVSRVPVGTTVRFLNTSTIDHAVVGRLTTWGSNVLSPGKEFSQTFVAAGTYPYTCPLHQGMVGAIVVGGDQAPVRAAAVTPQGAGDERLVADVGALALAGLFGLAIGLGSGVGVTRLRRRTTV
jgi:plastocyanin